MIRVLFVCMGNICRSPSAEGVFLQLVDEEGLLPYIEIDSAGTHHYHIGEQADPRSIAHAAMRQIDITMHRARQVTLDDFETYHHILAMDTHNLHHLMAQCPSEHQHKLQLFLQYAPDSGGDDVPDPYYGGPNGFNHVLDLVEHASRGLLQHLQKAHSLGHHKTG
jgi:protein-tyrosine phosphatase